MRAQDSMNRRVAGRFHLDPPDQTLPVPPTVEAWRAGWPCERWASLRRVTGAHITQKY